MSLNKIRFNYVGKRFKIEKKSVQLWLQAVAEEYGFKLNSLDIILCSDEYLLQINRDHLNHDYYTDIITFDLSDEAIKKEVIGELYISLDRVKENALSLGETPVEELKRVMVHGLLHLMGLKDKTEKQIKEMRSAEAGALILYRSMFHVK